MKRRRREQRCVPVIFTLIAAAGIDAPSVANNEHHGASHTSRTLPMNKKIDKQFFVPIEF